MRSDPSDVAGRPTARSRLDQDLAEEQPRRIGPAHKKGLQDPTDRPLQGSGPGYWRARQESDARSYVLLTAVPMDAATEEAGGAVQTGYSVAFGLTAGAMLTAVLPAWRSRR